MDWFEQVKFDEPQIVFEKATEIIYILIFLEENICIYIYIK